MKKKNYYLFLVILFVVPFIIFSCEKNRDLDYGSGSYNFSADEKTVAPTSGDPCVVELLAGQNTDVGEVSVLFNEDGTEMTVNYIVDMPGWCLLETHLDVQYVFDNFPTNKKGNPKVGHFQFSDDFPSSPCTSTWTKVVDLSGLDPDDYMSGDATVFIAAHAVVEYTDEAGNTTDETAWGEGNLFGGGNWSMYFECVYLEPECIPHMLATQKDLVNGKIYKVNTDDASTELIVEIPVNAPVSPASKGFNSNAYDAVNNVFYFNYYGGGADKKLYYVDLDDNSWGVLTTLNYQAMSGTFYNGSYYYITNGSATKDVIEVSIDYIGGVPTLVSETPWFSLDKYMNYGDITFREEEVGDNTITVMYGIGVPLTDGSASDNREFYSVHTDGTNYTTIYSFPKQYYNIQIAFGSDGIMYGVDAGTDPDGNRYLYQIDPSDFSLTQIGILDTQFTDLTDGPCLFE
jgi:hypothetical protein